MAIKTTSIYIIFFRIQLVLGIITFITSMEDNKYLMTIFFYLLRLESLFVPREQSLAVKNEWYHYYS
jgi:hypothetical protein